MSAPWTKEMAEQWAEEIVVNAADTSWGVAYSTGFLAGLAKAAEMIEACETVKFTLRDGKIHTGSYDLYEAKLVGVRPVGDSK